MKNSAVFILIFVVAAAGFVFATTTSGGPGRLAYRDAETVALGKTLYDANCASCHGVNLEGQPDWQQRDPDGYLPAPPHDATGHTWHHPTAQLFDITKRGTEAVVGGGYKSNMMGFGELLSDEEIHAILAFIKSTWPRPVIERHDELDAAYEAAN